MANHEIQCDGKWNFDIIGYSPTQGIIVSGSDGCISLAELEATNPKTPEPKQETWRDRAIKDPLF